MMNKFKKSVVVGFILVVSATLLSAASNAKELYQKTQEIDLGTQSIESIIDTFSMLREQVVKEMQTAREDLAERGANTIAKPIRKPTVGWWSSVPMISPKSRPIACSCASFRKKSLHEEHMRVGFLKTARSTILPCGWISHYPAKATTTASTSGSVKNQGRRSRYLMVPKSEHPAVKWDCSQGGG